MQLVDVTPEDEVNRLIGDALSESGARGCLGVETASAVRDVLIESAKNAFGHGGATHVTLSIEPRRIVLTDNGGAFDPTRLPSREGGGGRISFKSVAEDHSELVVSYAFREGTNQLTIVPVSLLTGELTASPCTLVVEAPAVNSLNAPIDTAAFAGCDTVLVRMPWYLSPSDAIKSGKRLASFADKLKCKLVLILPECSPTTVRLLQEYLPTARLVHAPTTGKRG
jgi:hypothetical protein